ncbi:MAG: serine/threonine-protein kinase PpkA, partial [Rubritalea sp.]
MEKLIKILLVGLVVVYTSSALAAEAPLLMEGKKTLYQRVLSTPDARLYASPEKTASSSEILPFSVLYVYQKKQDWIKVGHGSFGDTAGWVKQAQAIIWNQALTVSFKDPQNTQRVMLFESKEKLQALVEDYDKEAYQSLYESAVKGDVGADFPVIAIQPEAHIDILQDFYLVPIKQHEDVYLGNEQARLL